MDVSKNSDYFPAQHEMICFHQLHPQYLLLGKSESLNIIPINYSLKSFGTRIKCPYNLQITRCLKMAAYYIV